MNKFPMDRGFACRLIRPDTWFVQGFLESPATHVLLGKEQALVIVPGQNRNHIRKYIETIADFPVIVANTNSQINHSILYGQFGDYPIYPVEDVVDNVNILIKEGKVGVVGVSNWHIDRIAKTNTYAKKSGQVGFQLSQIQWSLASTLEEYFKKYTEVVMDIQSYDW